MVEWRREKQKRKAGGGELTVRCGPCDNLLPFVFQKLKI